MQLSASLTTVAAILPWRDAYRLEMGCQIIHDSIHGRPGWSQEYWLLVDENRVGYGSIAIAGPWKGNPTLYEWYVLPQYRLHLFDLFSTLLTASGAARIETQSNDPLLTPMLHAFAPSVASESILFHDHCTTSHAPPDAIFRRATSAEFPDLGQQQLDSHGVVELSGKVEATGGALFHYNRPYGDIFMNVTEACRQRGLGSFLVQELKRICYEQGSIPAARCNPKNIASRKTLQKAGFVPCGHILYGSLPT